MAVAQANFTKLDWTPGKPAVVQVAPLTTAAKPATFAASELQNIATIDGKEKVYANLESKFKALSHAWRWHNRGNSVLDYDDFTYLQIIGMGPAAVPLLLRDVRDGAGDWYFALKCITSQEADRPEMQGDADAVRDAWIEWGKRNGQLSIR